MLPSLSPSCLHHLPAVPLPPSPFLSSLLYCPLLLLFSTLFLHHSTLQRVLANVSCGVVRPRPQRPTEGELFFNVELSPMASPGFEVGRPSAQGTEVSRTLERCLKESRAIDTESLCIIAGEKVRSIYLQMIPPIPPLSHPHTLSLPNSCCRCGQFVWISMSWTTVATSSTVPLSPLSQH